MLASHFSMCVHSESLGFEREQSVLDELANRSLPMSLMCWRLFFSFLLVMHTHAYGHQKAPTRVQPPYTHMYSVPGLCFTRPGGRQQICLAGWLMPPAMLSHRQLMLGAHLWNPTIPMCHPCHPSSHTHTHHQTQGGGLGRVSSTSFSLFRLRESVWPGSPPPCPGEVGTHWQPSHCSPSHPRTYIWTHTNTETHTNSWTGLQPPPSPPHILLGAGPWIGDMWLGEMRHDAGLSLWQILCLSACLQITSLERLTKTEKEFCFPPFWLQQSPCPQLPSASGHCYPRAWYFSSLMAVVGCRICSSFDS